MLGWIKEKLRSATESNHEAATKSISQVHLDADAHRASLRDNARRLQKSLGPAQQRMQICMRRGDSADTARAYARIKAIEKKLQDIQGHLDATETETDHLGTVSMNLETAEIMMSSEKAQKRLQMTHLENGSLQDVFDGAHERRDEASDISEMIGGLAVDPMQGDMDPALMDPDELMRAAGMGTVPAKEEDALQMARARMLEHEARARAERQWTSNTTDDPFALPDRHDEQQPPLFPEVPRARSQKSSLRF
jgi:hypothetical protein